MSKPRTEQQNKERWSTISGVDGYAVSTFGRVMSCPRTITRSNRFKTFSFVSKQKILSQIIAFSGYVVVNMHRKQYLVHRLVAITFIRNKTKKPFINHKDGNKINNNVENLEWCTHSENILHSYRVLGRQTWSKGLFGARHPKSKPVLQKTLNGKLVKRWECASDAVRSIKADSGGITKACQGIQKTHLGFTWEYATKD